MSEWNFTQTCVSEGEKTFPPTHPHNLPFLKYYWVSAFRLPLPADDSTHIRRWKISMLVCSWLHVGLRYIITWQRREKKEDIPFIKAPRNYILYSTFVLATIGYGHYDSKDNYFLVIAARKNKEARFYLKHEPRGKQAINVYKISSWLVKGFVVWGVSERKTRSFKSFHVDWGGKRFSLQFTNFLDTEVWTTGTF